MSTFTVIVRMLDQPPFTYIALGTDSGAVHIAALDRHGACGVTVQPGQAQ